MLTVYILQGFRTKL